ncbi:MAG: Ger(x)C family spore germination protein [Syntrophomonadaceae bacterium]|nr:Ger(x)C family spore germination protein [Syntrophomonadaceae bacterium]
MKRVFAFLIIISLTFTMGCWDKKEITDLGIVVGLALDKGVKPDREVLATIQIANPKAFLPGGVSGNDEAFWTATGKGFTGRDAVDNMDYRIPKEVYFGQTRLLIIGKDAAQDGILPYLDRIWRSRQVRANMYITIAEGTGKSILEVVMPTFRSSAIAMVNFFSMGNREAILPMTLAEFTHDLSTSKGGAVAPMVATVEQSSVTLEDKKKDGSAPQTILVEKLAVFNSDGKMVGVFNEEETKGLVWILDKIESMLIKVPSPDNEVSEPVALRCTKSKRKTVVKLDEDGLPHFEIQVQADTTVEEYFGEGGELSKKWFLNSLEKRVNICIEQEIMAAIQKGKVLNCDVFLFGEEVKRQHVRAWNSNLKDRWEEIFPLVPVEVKVNSRIFSQGLSGDSPGTIKEE